MKFVDKRNMKTKRTSKQINHDLIGIYAKMGEAWKILRGFERKGISPKDVKYLAECGATYLWLARQTLGQIRKEIKNGIGQH
jgi:hypothetical protein